MDILMLSNPAEYKPQPGPLPTQFLTPHEFYSQEDLARPYHDVLWQAFNTRGKYALVVHHADWFCLATDKKKNYLASAFVIEIGQKWLIEYVMAKPDSQNKGAGSSVMDRIMTEAKKANIKWVILNCDPAKEDGKLPKFYGKFGFKQVD